MNRVLKQYQFERSVARESKNRLYSSKPFLSSWEIADLEYEKDVDKLARDRIALRLRLI